MKQTKPTVKLLFASPLFTSVTGARTCWDSFDKSDTRIIETCNNCGSTNIEKSIHDTYICYDCDSESMTCTIVDIPGDKDKELIERVGLKYKHSSILEHIVFSFKIEDVSRALLQELARHRLSSPSVRSTRYTLKEFKNEDKFCTYKLEDDLLKLIISDEQAERASKYLVWTGNSKVDGRSVLALEQLRRSVNEGISNDLAKYSLPDSLKTELTWTINLRSLRNFLFLRLNKSALWEIQNLAMSIALAIPDNYRYLINDIIDDSLESNPRLKEWYTDILKNREN